MYLILNTHKNKHVCITVGLKPVTFYYNAELLKSKKRVSHNEVQITKSMNIALRRFLHNHGNIATERSPKPGLCPTLISNDFKGSL